ncbi:uncharacterized protein BJ212DRAFT_1218920, partial [Suillus subaureus]
MGKYNHIVELMSTDEYLSCARTDPNNFSEYASVMPSPATARSPTAAEKLAMMEWIKEDAQMKGIICRKLSLVVQGLLDKSSTAHDQWNTLAMHFACLDMSLQFELCAQLFAEKLKDADNVSCYISVFEHARWCFTEMAITFTDDKAVFLLLQGLPQTPEWIIFKCMTITMYSSSSTPTTSSSATATVKMTFTTVAASLSEEANCIQGEWKLNGPGSEYTNVTGPGIPDSKVNPKTGICMHKSNPKGIAHDNPACVGLPCPLTHDHEHCFQLLQSHTPLFIFLSLSSLRKEVSVAATTDAPSNSLSPSLPTSHTTDLACAIIHKIDEDSPANSLPSEENIACIIHYTMSTILNSSMTLTIITNHKFFWTFSNDSHVTMKTANHGRLPTLGHGECIADLKIGGRTCCIQLTNCLHTPG